MSLSCREIEPELVGYHFGEVERESRSDIEAHLLECRACLRDFLALKREIETAETDVAPSRAARLALREAVAKEVRSPERRWSWWERPFAVVFAGAAVAVAFLAVQNIASGPGKMPHALANPPAASTGVQ